jgi:hypothetical protein
MFDNLRDFSDDPLYEDEQNDLYKDSEPSVKSSVAAPKRKRKKRRGKFLGMTAQQRFLVAFMFMFTVLLIGTLTMFVTGTMSGF